MSNSTIAIFKNFIERYKKNFFNYNYVFFSIILVVGLSTGKIIMSIATISLVVNWIVEGQFHEKIEIAKQRNYIPFLLVFGYISLSLWLLNSTDFSYAFRDLKIKLPLLFFPLVLGTIKLQKDQTNIIFQFFVLGVLFSTLISLLVYLKVIPIEKDISDVRNISIFVSHIRLSLLVCFSLVLLVYLWSKKIYFFNKYISIIISLWFVYFLLLLQAFTGLFILVALVISALVFFIVKKGNVWMKLGAVFIFLSLLVASLFHVNSIYKNNFIAEHVELSELDRTSKNGEVYQHRLEDNWLENGNRVWMYIAPKELEKGWNERSNIPFDSLDLKGQPMWGTLYRFLTSKGLRKDKEGLEKLTEQDVLRIESGETNCCEKLTGINRRIKEVFFEFERYKNGQDPNGHSFIQRILYLKAGKEIFLSNFYFGVGIGDVHQEFMKYYDETNSQLKGSNRKRVHNQYVSFAITIGFFGFVFWLFLFYYPFLLSKKNMRLSFYFLLIISISFLTDNTLERQAGVMFFAFFNSFLLFQKIEE